MCLCVLQGNCQDFTHPSGFTLPRNFSWAQASNTARKAHDVIGTSCHWLNSNPGGRRLGCLATLEAASPCVCGCHWRSVLQRSGKLAQSAATVPLRSPLSETCTSTLPKSPWMSQRQASLFCPLLWLPDLWISIPASRWNFFSSQPGFPPALRDPWLPPATELQSQALCAKPKLYFSHALQDWSADM